MSADLRASVKEIHRSMYAPQAEQKAVKVSRCLIMPRVGPKWQHLQEKCAPTSTQACDFESVTVMDMKGDPNDVFNHSIAAKFGREKGWTHIGGGRGRETFEFKTGCVVKFARSDRVNGRVVGARPWEGALSEAQAGGESLVGTEQNTYEVATFNQCADNIKELMVPIVAHSPKVPYKWLVLPKAEVGGSAHPYEYEEIADELDEELKRRGARVVDLHGGNVGKLEGNNVLVDYGFRTRCPVQKAGDTAVARKLTEFLGKPQDIPSAEQAKAPTARISCQRHGDCGIGLMCVNKRCTRTSLVHMADINQEIARVRKFYKEIPPSYRSDVKYGVDEALNEAKRQGNRLDMIMALFNIEQAERIIEDEKEKLRSIGVSTHREPTRPLTPPTPPPPKRVPSKCKGNFECPGTLACVNGKCVNPTSQVVINEALRVVKAFDKATHAEAKVGRFDELMDHAEQARIAGHYYVALGHINQANQLVEPRKAEGIAALFPERGWHPEKKTKHKGRHGLKRPRAEKGGELTQKRRILWARAGELRRHAKGHERESERREMIDQARFLEQQAWHYQTKQMRPSGKPPLSDPDRMLRILHPEQRQLFFGDVKGVAYQGGAFQPRGDAV